MIRIMIVVSVAQSCLTLCGPMDCSTPGFPVLHPLLELAQTQVYWVGAAIQPSHALPPSSLFAFNLSQFPVSQLLNNNELLLANVAFMSFLTHKLGTVIIVALAVFSRNSPGRVCASSVCSLYFFSSASFLERSLSCLSKSILQTVL